MHKTVKIIFSLILIYLCCVFFQVSSGISLLLGIAFGLFFWYKDDGKKGYLPPGPPQFPLIGCLGFIFAKHQYEYCDYVYKKYGPVVNVSVGNLPVFSVGDFQLAKEISLCPDFQLRPNIGIFAEFSKKMGIVASEGELWKHQRRFILHSLRDSGMGQIRMQDKIHEELVKVMDVLDESKSRPLYMHGFLEKSTSNIIFTLAFNKRFDYDDKDLISRIAALNENITLSAVILSLSIFSFLKPFLSGIRKKIFSNIELVKDQTQEFIDEHRATLDPSYPRDLLDFYLLEMDRPVEDSAIDAGYHSTFYEEQMKYLMIDIFVAGTETSSTTIKWALLYMIRHPEIQEKVRKEIDDVVGNERFPGMGDKSNLPFTTATLQEVERLGSAVAQSLPRSNGNSVTVRDYVFPKRSMVFFNLYSIHRDPKLWENPLDFNPSRFIDSAGKVFRPPHLIPFGSGKRACAGETLARMEIFLYFSTLLQNFVFEALDKNAPPPLTCPRGVIRGPSKYQIRCFRRHV